MNKNVILENRIEEIENETDAVKGKIARDIAIAILSAVGLILPGMLLKNIFINLSYPFFSLATIIPSLTLYDISVRNKSIKENDKEIQHLKNIGIKGIKKSRQHDEARYNKIEELKDLQYKTASKDKIYSVLSSIPAVGWLVASAASFLIPEALIASLISVALISVGCIASSKKEKEVLELETRIRNIENDLMLEPIFGYTASSKTKEPQKNIERKQSSKVTTMKQRKNESIVDKYLQDLEKQPKDGRKVYEKRY